MNRQQLPNLITCFRILLVTPILWGLIAGNYQLAFYSFALAGCSDGIDGYLARQYGWTSYFGSIADPLADKILLMSSFVALCWLGFVPIWLLLVVVFRDIWIMMGVVIYHYMVGQPKFTPSFISKLNTFLQILLITFLLLHLAFGLFSQFFIDVLMYVVLLTSLASFIDYTWVWGKRALRGHGVPQNESSSF